MLELNQLVDNPGARKKYKRLGRGIGSGKGKTCARGGKGQTARSGVALRSFEGGQTPLIRRIPKRGFTSGMHFKYTPVNLFRIAEKINHLGLKNIIIDKNFLLEQKLIKKISNIKILSFSYDKLDLSGIEFNVEFYSKAAKSSILAFGGLIKNINLIND